MGGWGRRWGVQARNNDYIQKAGCPRRQQTNVLEYHLIRVWMLVSFMEHRGGGGEEVK